jgi:hypothetical protein
MGFDSILFLNFQAITFLYNLGVVVRTPGVGRQRGTVCGEER